MKRQTNWKSRRARMFYAGETPGQRLGTRVEKELTAPAAIRLAGWDWEVQKRPLYIASRNTVDAQRADPPESVG